MDYRQERVTTLHDLTDPVPDAPVTESAVVVPIAGESLADVTPEYVFGPLETVDPGEVVVPLRTPAGVAEGFREWVADYDLDVTTLWCDAPAIETLLESRGIGGNRGKGRDVWLGVGVAAARADYVAVHDADARTYSSAVVPRLLAPLAMEHDFVKGYYARVEDGRLYGRLVRLFVAPLLRALGDRHDADIVRYLSAFRYPLAGEFAFTAEAARKLRAQRAWGLEIGMLGETFDVVGPDRSAQADLGVHRHDHKPVSGRGGLSGMADQVGQALFRALEEGGVDPDYGTLPDAYRDAATRLVSQYAADAAFNGLEYDTESEREQVDAYVSGVQPPGPDSRLPAWDDTDLSPAAVLDAGRLGNSLPNGSRSD
ncbi:glycosyl transferase family 2 [Haloarcula pelagica]|uniref:glycosyl transferase family 2 n=1 Tax=Haloarcula pelagica TaxID=3033389 RepID=UPI0024C3B78E|nr:glycosyl transferase family 2 [Halomicroarcula sp. YJ-61-S]